ncbi:MAG TPA: hypothetical protein VFH88_05445 [Candidatus Krumholzibacteria bacterium]|nr:hypothetical protein [Candidatus Krumholzibacteria bacterium]
MRTSLHAVLILGVILPAMASPVLANDSFFDVYTIKPTEGLAPHLAHQASTLHQDGATYALDLYDSITLESVTWGTPTGVSPYMRCTSVNYATPNPDIARYLFVQYVNRDGRTPWNQQSFWDIQFQSAMQLGDPPAGLMVINSGAPPGSVDSFFDISYTGSGFDINYRVQAASGFHDINLHGSIQKATPLTFLSLMNSPSGAAVFDIELTLDWTGGAVDETKPIVQIVTTGQYTTSPVRIQTATWGRTKILYR